MDKEIVALIIKLCEQIYHLKEIEHKYDDLIKPYRNPLLPSRIHDAEGNYREVSQDDIMLTYAKLAEINLALISLEQNRATPAHITSRLQKLLDAKTREKVYSLGESLRS
jgi:hypothetical protein